MKEAYVSYKVARLLKEKGFNGHCHVVHINNHNSLIGKVISNSELTTTHEYKFCKDQENCITIPTQQMAMCWLREEKMIFISPFPTFKSSPTFKSRLPYSWRVDIKNCFGEELGGNYEYITYEDAVESALEYVLTNLI